MRGAAGAVTQAWHPSSNDPGGEIEEAWQAHGAASKVIRSRCKRRASTAAAGSSRWRGEGDPRSAGPDPAGRCVRSVRRRASSAGV